MLRRVGSAALRARRRWPSTAVRPPPGRGRSGCRLRQVRAASPAASATEHPTSRDRTPGPGRPTKRRATNPAVSGTTPTSCSSGSHSSSELSSGAATFSRSGIAEQLSRRDMIAAAGEASSTPARRAALSFENSRPHRMSPAWTSRCGSQCGQIVDFRTCVLTLWA